MVPAFDRYRDIIPEFRAFLSTLNTPQPTHIRINPFRVKYEEFQQTMGDRRYRLVPVAGIPDAFRWESNGTPGSTLEYFRGWYQVQGLTSMLPPRILDPRPEERLLDMCAAPGGKATYLAQLTQNQALIIANDVSHHRIGILRSHCDRLGITSIIVTRYRAQSFPMRMQFDRILLDPPCSAEGTYRTGRRPPLTEEPQVSYRLQRLQQMLLDRGLELLRPGGTLVYSTCTYAPEENEAVLQEAVEGGRAEVVPIDVPFPYAPGLEVWNGQRFHPSLKQAARFYPHIVDSWGFFIACLRKPD